jgi:hypothetical protein
MDYLEDCGRDQIKAKIINLETVFKRLKDYESSTVC